jgi:hypothetical protein
VDYRTGACGARKTMYRWSNSIYKVRLKHPVLKFSFNVLTKPKISHIPRVSNQKYS